MREVKFTKGPWKVVGRKLDDDSSDDVMTDSSPSVRISNVYGGTTYPPGLANAQLIAIAPEMFDLLAEYELFEADLILNGNWDYGNGVRMSQAQHDWMMRLQEKRNTLLNKVSVFNRNKQTDAPNPQEVSP